MADDTLREATGRGWDEWCDIIDAWPGHPTAIPPSPPTSAMSTAWRMVGPDRDGRYERITGLRLPYQQPDGTFSAGKSRTVTADAGLIREMLLDDEDRADLFPSLETELRSTTSKVLHIGIGPGTAQIALDPQDEGRVKITVAHDKLPTAEAVEEWKGYWSDWLEAVDGA